MQLEMKSNIQMLILEDSVTCENLYFCGEAGQFRWIPISNFPLLLFGHKPNIELN